MFGVGKFQNPQLVYVNILHFSRKTLMCFNMQQVMAYLKAHTLFKELFCFVLEPTSNNHVFISGIVHGSNGSVQTFYPGVC